MVLKVISELMIMSVIHHVAGGYANGPGKIHASVISFLMAPGQLKSASCVVPYCCAYQSHDEFSTFDISRHPCVHDYFSV